MERIVESRPETIIGARGNSIFTLPREHTLDMFDELRDAATQLLRCELEEGYCERSKKGLYKMTIYFEEKEGGLRVSQLSEAPIEEDTDG